MKIRRIVVRDLWDDYLAERFFGGKSDGSFLGVDLGWDKA